MKTIFKCLLFPVFFFMHVIIWALSGILYISAPVFGLISSLIGLLGLAVLATYSTLNGLILLLIAFLVSPLGVPMLAAQTLGTMLSFISTIRDM